jgi:ABC-2 type transport system ATP-binding protein
VNDPIIEVHDLTKTYHKKTVKDEAGFWARWLPMARQTETLTAVDHISFTIARGEIFGLLGPNGAGKTTTIKMLCTLLEPTTGTATVAGYDVVRQAAQVRQNLGAVMTGERSIYWKLTGRENLAYFAALYHLPPAVARQRVNAVLEQLDLTKRADELVERYSSGMKQRVAIGKALLAKPPVLLLDEPTIGLDPQSARNLRELILEFKREGHTILLTTHYMEEADQLCDRIGIVDQGRIIALDTPTALKATINRLDVLQVEVENFEPSWRGDLTALPTVETLTTEQLGHDGVWSLALHTGDSRNLLPQLIQTIGARQGRIRHLQVKQPTLEDVFIALTGKQLRE